LSVALNASFDQNARPLDDEASLEARDQMARQGRPSIAVTRLSLSAFRSYSNARIDLEPTSAPIVLTGPNGAGKTNILEALSFLSPGSGLRRAVLGEVSNVDMTAPWAVATQVALGDDQVAIGTGLSPDCLTGGTMRRIVRVDGEDQTNQSVLADMLSVVWLTPQMDRIFIEGASSRRRFLDRMVMALHPDHGRQYGAFERLMRERSKLLSDHGVKADPAWLSALEARMAEHAVAVAIARLDYAGQLAGQIDAASDGAFPKAILALDGWIENRLDADMPAVDAEVMYRDALLAARHTDAASGRASIGAHKMDLLVSHRVKGMRADLCSTGEQKALLIGLTLAGAKLKQAVSGTAPLVLLDEVAAHLDDVRRAALFDELSTLGSQCWLTGTDQELFQALQGRAIFFQVVDGNIQRETGSSSDES